MRSPKYTEMLKEWLEKLAELTILTLNLIYYPFKRLWAYYVDVLAPKWLRYMIYKRLIYAYDEVNFSQIEILKQAIHTSFTRAKLNTKQHDNLIYIISKLRRQKVVYPNPDIAFPQLQK